MMSEQKDPDRRSIRSNRSTGSIKYDVIGDKDTEESATAHLEDVPMEEQNTRPDMEEGNHQGEVGVKATLQPTKSEPISDSDSEPESRDLDCLWPSSSLGADLTAPEDGTAGAKPKKKRFTVKDFDKKRDPRDDMGEATAALELSAYPGHPSDIFDEVDEAKLWETGLHIPQTGAFPLYNNHHFNIAPNQTYWEFNRSRELMYLDAPDDFPTPKLYGIARKAEYACVRCTAEVCIFPRVILSWIVIVFLELWKLLIRSLCQPCCVGLLYLWGGLVFKPCLAAYFNNCVHPLMIFAYHSIKLAMVPFRALMELFGLFLHQISVCCRSFKPIQIGGQPETV